MVSRFRRVAGATSALLALTLPASLPAATPLPSAPVAAATLDENPQAHPQGQEECFSGYQFGHILVHIDEGLADPVLLPGQALEVRGKIENPTDMPLPDGKLLASVLREDPTVAAAHWHPIVASFQAPGDYSLPPRGEVPFTVVWTVPENAPSGRYRVELSYLSGRYPVAGLPYVTNVPAAVEIFTIVTPHEASSVTFDRSRVTVNGTPYVFRAVPAPLSPGEPLRITAPIVAAAPQPVSVTVTAALYAWSGDTDGKPPLATKESTLDLAPGKPVTVPFTWETPAPGAYEIVFTATPQNPGVLPSLLKVRVPITGFVPRIAFSGITHISGDEATVTTCVTNATLGTPENSSGSITTKLLAGGKVLGEKTKEFTSSSDGDLFAVSFPAAARALTGDIRVETETKDASGIVTDTDVFAYSAAVLSASPMPSPRPPRTTLPPAAPPRRAGTSATTLVVLLLLLVGGGTIAALMSMSRRRHGHPR